ncbi:MAG: hypothetical protein PHY10_03120, partial [Patescibacteria group bacterium]|nr:hypothetical protein [Patescibacteria group bacterium]
MNVENLKEYLKKLKILRTQIKGSKSVQIHKKILLSSADSLSNYWFNEIKPILSRSGFTLEQLDNYDKKFTHLLKLASSKGNKKDNFLLDLKFVIKSFTDDIILKIQTGNGLLNPLSGTYDFLLQTIQDKEQNKYLKEAINCAKDGYLRAAIVLGWCAAIDQIHKKIEQLGFIKFNVASAQMASAQMGRFKRYKEIIKISSLDDLKEVFDNKILWVIEGMGLIDLNQHTRLKSCFDMRNHC